LIIRQAGKWPSQRGGVGCWRKPRSWRSFATQKLESWSSLAPASSMISLAPGQFLRSLWYILVVSSSTLINIIIIISSILFTSWSYTMYINVFFFRYNAMLLSSSVPLICVLDQVSFLWLWFYEVVWRIDPKVLLVTIIMQLVMCAIIGPILFCFFFFFYFQLGDFRNVSVRAEEMLMLLK